CQMPQKRPQEWRQRSAVACVSCGVLARLSIHWLAARNLAVDVRGSANLTHAAPPCRFAYFISCWELPSRLCPFRRGCVLRPAAVDRLSIARRWWSPELPAQAASCQTGRTGLLCHQVTRGLLER